MECYLQNLEPHRTTINAQRKSVITNNVDQDGKGGTEIMSRFQPTDFSSVMKSSCQGYTLMNLDTRHVGPPQIALDTSFKNNNSFENNRTFKYDNSKLTDMPDMIFRDPPACMFSEDIRQYYPMFDGSRVLFESKLNMNQDPAMRSRPCFSSQQTQELEREFILGQYITRKRRLELAFSLDLTEKQIKTWFQNRRVKERKTRKCDR